MNGTERHQIHTLLPTESGVILIALLWILTALAVIALSFSKECRVEAVSAMNSRSMDTAYYAAQAGIANAIYQVKLKKQLTQVNQSTTQEAVDTIDLGYLTGSFGGAEYRVDIQDESGKINLNQVQEQQLRLLVEACGIPQPDSDIIADSILDWRTSPPSGQARANGAKDDYYLSLDLPYYCKGANFDTVEELLLVRGVTTDYFYGHPERDQNGDIVYAFGLSRCFTVYSPSGVSTANVNANSAPLPVLLSTGMSVDAALAIIAERRVQPFSDLPDLQSRVSSLSMAQGLSVGPVKNADILTLIAIAQAEGSNARRVIRTTINISPQDQNYQYQTLYWNENIPDYEGYAYDLF
jgi:general secretion pathway protein K